MIEVLEVDALGGGDAAEALVGVRERLLAAEADRVRLAAHWADLHAPEFVADCFHGLPASLQRRDAPGEGRGGRERVVRASIADGCPEMGEFAAAELGVLLGLTGRSAQTLVADAVMIRHRHPLLWAGIAAGSVRVWLACQVARRCAAAQLSLEQALWVDLATSDCVASLPVSRFLALVDATIIKADPAAAAQRAEAAGSARFVRAGQSDEYGLRTLVARARAGEVTVLVAVLDRIASILAEQGDTSPPEVRRAEALRILANPARALALLTSATLTELDPDPDRDRDPGDEPPADPEVDLPAAERGVPGTDSEWVGWMSDVTGRALYGVPRRGQLQPIPDAVTEAALPGLGDGLGDGLRDGLAGGLVIGGGPAPSDLGPPQPSFDVETARSLVAALERFDASVFDPVAVFHVHLTDTVLKAASSAGDDGGGVARVEELGPMVTADLKAWLAGWWGADRQRIRCRPVLDAAGVHAVDAYEFPDRMRQIVTVRNPYEVFPWGTLPSRKADFDHIEAYDDTGPRGQTSLEQAAPLGRLHHRLKTHGGWVLRCPEPGVFWWRTPKGYWCRVDAEGTSFHGRDPALDNRWLRRDATSTAA